MNNDCIEWAGYRDKDGYGQSPVTGKTRKAHRLAWEEANGPIPDGAYVCHSCDNPPCINANHLFLSTNAGNTADKMSKGRHGCGRGENHGMAKLTESDATQIRCDARIQRVIAEEYKVSQPLISLIKTRKIWGGAP